MPAKDIYHDTVKRALIKDGWTITAENFQLRRGAERTPILTLLPTKFLSLKKKGGNDF